jgi:hypothetical protein
LLGSRGGGRENRGGRGGCWLHACETGRARAGRQRDVTGVHACVSLCVLIWGERGLVGDVPTSRPVQREPALGTAQHVTTTQSPPFEGFQINFLK